MLDIVMYADDEFPAFSTSKISVLFPISLEVCTCNILFFISPYLLLFVFLVTTLLFLTVGCLLNP